MWNDLLRLVNACERTSPNLLKCWKKYIWIVLRYINNQLYCEQFIYRQVTINEAIIIETKCESETA